MVLKTSRQAFCQKTLSAESEPGAPQRFFEPVVPQLHLTLIRSPIYCCYKWLRPSPQGVTEEIRRAIAWSFLLSTQTSQLAPCRSCSESACHRAAVAATGWRRKSGAAPPRLPGTQCSQTTHSRDCPACRVA